MAGLTPGAGVDVTTTGAGTLRDAAGVIARDLHLDLDSLLPAGDMEVTGLLRWVRGTVQGVGQLPRLVAGGGLEIEGPGGVIDTILENRGAARLHGVVFGLDGELVNAAGARFDVGEGRLSGIGRVRNHGLFTGAGIVDPAFANHGEVRVDDGALVLRDLSGDGHFEVASGASLTLDGGTLGATATVHSQGQLEIGFATRNDGHVDATGGSVRLLGASMNRGSIDVGPAASLRVDGGGQDANGVLRAAGPSRFGSGSGIGYGAFEGTLSLEGSVHVDGGGWRFAAPGQRLGATLSARSGGGPRIEIAADGSAGTLFLEQTLLTIRDSRLDVDGAATFRGGALALAGGSLFAGSGLLTGEATHVLGSGALGGDLVMRAALLPGAAAPRGSILTPGFANAGPAPLPPLPGQPPVGDPVGKIVVQGDLLLGAGSRLEIQLDADDAGGVAHDRVTVGGGVQLAGALAVSVLDDALSRIDPTAHFVVLDAGEALAGIFDGLPSGARIDGGPGSFRVHYGAGSPYDPSQLVLSDFRVPEPSLLVLLGIAGLAWLVRRPA